MVNDLIKGIGLSRTTSYNVDDQIHGDGVWKETCTLNSDLMFVPGHPKVIIFIFIHYPEPS